MWCGVFASVLDYLPILLTMPLLHIPNSWVTTNAVKLLHTKSSDLRECKLMPTHCPLKF